MKHSIRMISFIKGNVFDVEHIPSTSVPAQSMLLTYSFRIYNFEPFTYTYQLCSSSFPFPHVVFDVIFPFLFLNSSRGFKIYGSLDGFSQAHFRVKRSLFSISYCIEFLGRGSLQFSFDSTFKSAKH